MRELTRGELAKQAQVNPETIRFYERKGLLPKATRGSNGYRLFPANAVERINFVARAKNLGFSLLEIRDLLSIEADDLHACAEVKDRLATKLVIVQEKKAELEQLETQIAAALQTCRVALQSRSKTTKPCPVFCCLSNPAKQ
jgi:DNA-binding transcriptional MerR regulator